MHHRPGQDNTNDMLNIISTTLALATLIIGITADCGSLGPAGKSATWHANTDADYTGGNADDICGCLDALVNIDSCKLEYAFPDGKSAWGTLVYCTGGKTALEQGSRCLGTGGSGWILTAG